MILSGLWTCPSHAPRFQRTILRNSSASSGAVLRASSIQSKPRSAWPSLAQGDSLVERQVRGVLSRMVAIPQGLPPGLDGGLRRCDSVGE